MPPDELIPTRQSLLERLRRWDDQCSWQEFFDAYWGLIYGVARKAGLNDADAQDVVQETIIATARKMPAFRYDPAVGTFKAWLMRLTRWRIADHFRRQQYERDGQRLPREQPLDMAFLEQQPEPGGPDVELLWEEEWQRHVLELAISRVRQQNSPLQFQAFQLHALHQLPARQVAQRLGLKLSEVYFAKYKLAAQIRREVQALEETLS
jgi:RNA polymerase sigma-70 factor (ECF subfamily)